MTATAIIGARILAQGQWLDGHALITENGRVSAVLPVDFVPAGMAVERTEGGFLLPGFFDTQVNGGGGILFNDHPNLAGVAAIADAHRGFGTTAMLPTLISDDLDIVARAIAAVEEAIDVGIPGVAGIHIEGPYLNPAKQGIHDAGKFRRLDAGAADLLSSLRGGRTLVTLAPECAEPGVIAALTQRGVTVAAGHSMARYSDIERAVQEGLRGVTHLYNAMTQLNSREPGLVGAAIDLGLISGLIVDGHHVHPASLRTAYRAKGARELMLVTDAMPCVGTKSDGFMLGNLWIQSESGVLRGPGGTLAGSNLDMASALRNAVTMMHISVAEASHMASATPAAFMGLDTEFGSLAPGQRADMVHLDDHLMPQATWIAGTRI